MTLKPGGLGECDQGVKFTEDEVPVQHYEGADEIWQEVGVAILSLIALFF